METENQTELNYTQQKIYFFSESTSGEGLEDTDIICTINIPLIVRKRFTHSIIEVLAKNVIGHDYRVEPQSCGLFCYINAIFLGKYLYKCET